jgi:Tol biopolymer transport system component
VTLHRKSANGVVAAFVGAAGLLLTAAGAGGAESLALGSDSPTWSPDGSMIAFVGFRGGRPGDIYTIRRDRGRERRLTKTAAHEDLPRWSSDGRRIAFTRGTDRARRLFVMNADGTAARQLTFGSEPSFGAAWSPDASKIAFVRGRDTSNNACDDLSPDGAERCASQASADDAAEIWVMNADGSGETRLTHNEFIDDSPTWSPDGALIAFTSDRGGVGAHQLYVMRPDGTQQRKLTDDPISYHNERRPSWSPDGSTIAFVADRDAPAGTTEIYAVDADGRNVRRLTWSVIHEDWPTWSPDGELAISRGTSTFRPEIFVMSADGSLTRRVTGRDLQFVRLTLPRSPRAADKFAVELTVRPAIDMFTDTECTAALDARLLSDARVALVSGRLRCVWTLPRDAKGKLLTGTVLASSRGSEVVRSFSVRVR